MGSAAEAMRRLRLCALLACAAAVAVYAVQLEGGAAADLSDVGTNCCCSQCSADTGQRPIQRALTDSEIIKAGGRPGNPCCCRLCKPGEMPINKAGPTASTGHKAAQRKKQPPAPKSSAHEHEAGQVVELGSPGNSDVTLGSSMEEEDGAAGGKGRRGGATYTESDMLNMDAASFDASSNRAGNSEDMFASMGDMGEEASTDVSRITLSGFGGQQCVHAGSGVASTISMPRNKWVNAGNVTYTTTKHGKKTKTLTMFLYATSKDDSEGSNEIWGTIHSFTNPNVQQKEPCVTKTKACSSDADCGGKKGYCNLSDGVCHTCTPVCTRKNQGLNNGHRYWGKCEEGIPTKIRGLLGAGRAKRISTMLLSTKVPATEGVHACFSKCDIPKMMFERKKTCNANQRDCIAVKCAFGCITDPALKAKLCD